MKMKLFRKLFEYLKGTIDQNNVGEQAQRLLDRNSAFMIAIESLQWRLMQEWANTKTNEKDKREKLKYKFDLVCEVVEEIEQLESQMNINKMELEDGREQTRH